MNSKPASAPRNASIPQSPRNSSKSKVTLQLSRPGRPLREKKLVERRGANRPIQDAHSRVAKIPSSTSERPAISRVYPCLKNAGRFIQSSRADNAHGAGDWSLSAYLMLVQQRRRVCVEAHIDCHPCRYPSPHCYTAVPSPPPNPSPPTRPPPPRPSAEPHFAP